MILILRIDAIPKSVRCSEVRDRAPPRVNTTDTAVPHTIVYGIRRKKPHNLLGSSSPTLIAGPWPRDDGTDT